MLRSSQECPTDIGYVVLLLLLSPSPTQEIKESADRDDVKCISIIVFALLQNNCTNRSVRQHRTMSAVLCVFCFINILRVATSNKFNQAKTKTNQRMFCNPTVAYRQKTYSRQNRGRGERRGDTIGGRARKTVR